MTTATEQARRYQGLPKAGGAGRTIVSDGDTLTPRQAELVRIIWRFFKEQGSWPVVDDLRDATGIKSPNGIMHHVRALRAKGWLEPEAAPLPETLPAAGPGYNRDRKHRVPRLRLLGCMLVTDTSAEGVRLSDFLEAGTGSTSAA